MKSIWAKVAAAVLAVAVIVTAIILIAANRPLIEAPKGTAPLDNKLDTSSVAHLVVDEANILSEETEQIICIYNVNWNALAERCMAVVTVESTSNAENDAWEWVQRLSLGKDDALLLMEAGGDKECALVADGTFRDDLATLKEGYLERLTYMAVRADEFDMAALAVCERMHYFCGYDAESHRRANVTEGVIVIAIIGLFVVPFLFHQIAEKIDNRRFRRWYENYGKIDPSMVPWRTVFLWHRRGSRWYNARISGEWVDYGGVIRSGQREIRARNFRGGRFR